jgi:phosphotransferase system enzyme I (PtsP)
METYRLFANDKSWLRRLEASVATGLKAEAAVDAARTEARTKIDRARDPYLRERLNDMDDLAQRLLRRLMAPTHEAEPIPENAILIARAIGPGELMDYPRGTLAGIVLEEGSPSSHATIVARALDIPLVVQAGRCARETNQGDMAIVNGDQGHVHFRPRADVVTAYEEKLTLRIQEKQAFAALRPEPAQTLDGHRIELHINAGLSADLPSLAESGGEGVGLLRTELHFMLNRRMPTREEQTSFYSHILDKADGKPVNFRTLDVGSDKVLPFLKQLPEENPALGWRAIRLGLDRPAILKMQAQALLRAAKGRPMRIMFPMVADLHEFERARAIVLEELERLNPDRHVPPSSLDIGAMLETPSLVFEDDRFFKMADFISIGGNDLMQFFFAADRMNELTAGRYDLTSGAFLRMLRVIVERCRSNETRLSFCGESAGRPLDALAIAATGVTNLSMRPAAVGPVKRAIRAANLAALHQVIATAETAGQPIRQALLDHCNEAGIPV